MDPPRISPSKLITRVRPLLPRIIFLWQSGYRRAVCEKAWYSYTWDYSSRKKAMTEIKRDNGCDNTTPSKEVA